MPDTRITKQKLKDHWGYSGKAYIIGALVAVALASMFFTMVTNREPADKYSVNFAIVRSYSNTEQLNGVSDALLTRIVRGIRAGDPESFMRELQALLADVPYERGKPEEAYFRNLVFIIFRLVGFHCEVEHSLAGGRSDTVVKTDKYIYVLEIKVDQSAEAALAQIEEKGYAEPYAADSRKLFKLGVNFSTKTKRIDEWRAVEA